MIDGMVSCFARASQLRSWLYAWYLGVVPGRWIVVKQGRRRHRRLESGGFVYVEGREDEKYCFRKIERSKEKSTLRGRDQQLLSTKEASY